MSAPHWIATILAGLLFVLAGCGGGGGSPTAPPSGWEASESRMWKEGVDTSKVFRDLNSLSSMGILEKEFALTSGGLNQEQFKKAIKRSIQKLYRNNPTIVDSLFEEHAASQLEDADLSGTVIEDGQLKPKLLNKYKKKAFQAIKDHYRQPTLQEGVSGITYPDSLRQADVTGTVRLQMHINSSGSVDAIEVVESVHPTLDAIAMKAGTQTKWNPGAVKQGDEWVSRGGWGRSPVPFRLR